ncbi:MAG TPA: acyl carrier protein [Bacilli bacterium]|nr:acyl carrier protein [Bacilli bacterium]
MVFDRIKAIVVKELGIAADKIKLDSHLVDDLGADSLDAVELVMAVEEEFNIEISDEAAQNIRKIKDIVDYVESKM